MDTRRYVEEHVDRHVLATAMQSITPGKVQKRRTHCTSMLETYGCLNSA